jgi:hypothetical protein
MKMGRGWGNALRNTHGVSFIVELSTAKWREVIGHCCTASSPKIKETVEKYWCCMDSRARNRNYVTQVNTSVPVNSAVTSCPVLSVLHLE